MNATLALKLIVGLLLALAIVWIDIANGSERQHSRVGRSTSVRSCAKRRPECCKPAPSEWEYDDDDNDDDDETVSSRPICDRECCRRRPNAALRPGRPRKCTGHCRRKCERMAKRLGRVFAKCCVLPEFQSYPPCKPPARPSTSRRPRPTRPPAPTPPTTKPPTAPTPPAPEPPGPPAPPGPTPPGMTTMPPSGPPAPVPTLPPSPTESPQVPALTTKAPEPPGPQSTVPPIPEIP